MKYNSEITKAIEDSEAFNTSVGKGTGWRPQPEDDRDFRFRANVITPLPTKHSLRQYCPYVRDQGQQGACTGFAVTYAIGMLRRITSHWDTLYSPQFVYNNARHMINELGVDYGAYIRDAVKSVAKYGAARENDFMYYEVERIQFKLPPDEAYESARSWRLGSYYAVHSLTDLKRALYEHKPVVGGMLCYSNMNSYSTWQSGVIPEPSGSIDGGHAICFTGYDDEKRLVQFINSWGSYWGDEGFGYLPYSFFETGKVSDMWALSGESPDTSFPKKGDFVKPA